MKLGQQLDEVALDVAIALPPAQPSPFYCEQPYEQATTDAASDAAVEVSLLLTIEAAFELAAEAAVSVVEAAEKACCGMGMHKARLSHIGCKWAVTIGHWAMARMQPTCLVMAQWTFCQIVM